MLSRRRLSLLAAAAATAAVAVPAASAATGPGGHATLVIRHQTKGCHAWSVNNGPYAPRQSVALGQGGWLIVTNDDLMPHLLVQTGGPAAKIVRVAGSMHDMATSLRGPGLMAHMGAGLEVSFAKPGVYRFTTKAGEDYMAGVKTFGPDNVLLLTVTVS